MYRKIEDFLSVWTTESQGTQRVLDALDDGALGRLVAEGYRDLARLGWHIVETLVEMPARFGLHHGTVDDAVPAQASAISARYRELAAAVAASVSAWSDADLEREDEMYGEAWKRGFSLHVLVLHQAHHRAQMTVLLRQAGLPVPDIYGPTRDDWAKFGMPTPAI